MDTNQAVAMLSALAQSTRLSVFRLLVAHAREGLAAGEIAAELGIANNTLSFHLKELAQAGLIRSRQEGRFVYYAPELEAMNAVVGFLLDECCQGTQACAPAQAALVRRARARCA